MSARVLHESALRVSDCVTELLRKQPFFGSLVLRLPLRPDPTRETLATDGREIRYSPRWVAETDSHLIETAMGARGHGLRAQAPHAPWRAGPRALGRWPSQLVTHALIRDAGFTLPRGRRSVGRPHRRAGLRPPPPPGRRSRGRRQRIPRRRGAAGAGATEAGQSPSDDDDDTGDPSDSADHADGQAGDGQDNDGASDAPPSHDPSGTGEVMDADARAGDEPAEAPVDVTRRGAGMGTRPCTRRSTSPAPRGKCRARSRRPSRARTRVRSTGARCCGAT